MHITRRYINSQQLIAADANRTDVIAIDISELDLGFTFDDKERFRTTFMPMVTACYTRP